jgi:predicted secreted protein
MFRHSTFRSAFLVALMLAGCSSAPRPVAPAPDAAESPQDTSVEISYVLGHTLRSLVAESGPWGTHAKALLDRQIVESGQVDPQRYREFLKKASVFVEATQKSAPNPVPCRSPYSVTLRRGAVTQVAKGCRSSDEGTLSHLIRDGEFLLSSKK